MICLFFYHLGNNHLGDLMLNVIFRTTIMYSVIIFAIRIMGKRQIGDLQPSDLVITILLSEIVAIPIQDSNIPLYYGLAATVTLIVLQVLTSVLTMKFLSARKILYGNSCIIINNGTINQEMLKKLRVTGPDLLEVLRNQEIFDISQVAYAILETNGQLSVLLKDEYQTANVNDIKGIHQSATLPKIVISDGRIIKRTIQDNGWTTEDITAELNKNNLTVKDVFIMTCDENKNYYLIKKQK